MRVRQILIVMGFATVGCASHLASDDVITDFSAVNASVGSRVTVTGFISHTHEAAGLYFRLEDLRAENDKCVVPVSFAQFSHGERVSLSGTLIRTDCGGGRVCTNLCDAYELR